MARPGSDDGFERRLRSETAGLLLERMRLAIPASIVLFPSYYVLDRVFTPELAGRFLGFRAVVVAEFALSLALTWTRVGRERLLVPLSLGFILSASFAISLMTSCMGGFASDYYVGNMIVMNVGALFMPWTMRQGLVFVGLFLGFYFGINLWAYGPSVQALLPLFFLGGNALFTLLALGAGDRTRRRTLAQQIEIERARDELKRMDENKTRFFSNVSHELRTPLTILLGPLEKSLRLGEPPSRGTLEAMDANARRLLRQVNLLLDFARIEAGHMRLHAGRGNLGALLEELCKAASIHAEKSGIRLLSEGLGSIPDSSFDVDKMETAIANLVSNALKFTPAGGTITVRARHEGGLLGFEVADTGIGIPADQLERVFERFHQVGDTQARDTSGTGLGLAMVREIARLHGGRAWATSAPGQGSVFRVEVPAVDVAGPAVAGARGGADRGPAGPSLHFADIGRSKALGDRAEERALSAANALVGPGAGDLPRVLVVEDTPDLRALIVEALVEALGEGYRVLQAVNGRHGLEEALRHSPDLILSDVMMPEMTGIELCARVRAEPALRAVPFVLLTAKTDIESRLGGLQDGADDYLTKPFNEAELQARVRNLLALQAQRKLIERQRAREFEQAKLASLGQMASGMAHEINSPLATLQLAVNRLRSVLAQPAPGALGEGLVTRLFPHIAASVARVSAVVRGIRMFSQEGSADPLRDEPLDRVVGLALEASRRRLADAGVELEYAPAEPSPLVRCRAYELSQAVAHLLNNAVDAMDGQERRRVRVETAAIAGSARVTVQDSGPGVAPPIRERIFEPFFTTRDIGRGMGLGLSIARGVVEANGGTLRLDEGFAGGARFVIELPAAMTGSPRPS